MTNLKQEALPLGRQRQNTPTDDSIPPKASTASMEDLGALLRHALHQTYDMYFSARSLMTRLDNQRQHLENLLYDAQLCEEVEKWQKSL